MPKRAYIFMPDDQKLRNSIQSFLSYYKATRGLKRKWILRMECDEDTIKDLKEKFEENYNTSVVLSKK